MKLCAIVLFNVCKSNIDFFTDSGIVPITIEVIKGRGLVHDKAFTTHSTSNALFVAVILLAVFLASICVHVAQILYKEHGEYVILVTRAVDLSTEAVACIPKYFFNILLGCHYLLPLFILS